MCVIVCVCVKAALRVWFDGGSLSDVCAWGGRMCVVIV